MLCFPSMLVQTAQSAGMSIPPDAEEFMKMEEVARYRETHPHFFVFCATQLCRAMQWGEEEQNAQLIASYSIEEIKTKSLVDLIEAGLCYPHDD